MELKSIKISNYRSIEEISFDIVQLSDKSFSYGLIGVNEAGKSSILNALALKEVKQDGTGLISVNQNDFKYKSKPIEIIFCYFTSSADIKRYRDYLEGLDPPVDSSGLDLSTFIIKVDINVTDPTQRTIQLEFPNINREDKLTIEKQLNQTILVKIHKSIFWTAEDRYLITKPINLVEFANSPEAISIPLKNCFILAGVSNILDRINGLAGDSTEIEQLENELSEKVTEHIKTVWPNHPIEITFKIDSGLINFHVKDTGTEGKAKVVSQRSDGFKQFISFLLTISAQDRNNELSNSLLLLDEPETHLHPEAQEYLLHDLIKITTNERNNIVYFATHSNYMIDKDDLSRNFRIIKANNDKTQKTQFDRKTSTYASVTYEVFGIPSMDYHSELYSRLHQKYQDIDINDEKREGIMNFDTNYLNKEKGFLKNKPWKNNANQATLPTYIRNCMNHSNNGNKFSKKELTISIDMLRKCL